MTDEGSALTAARGYLARAIASMILLLIAVIGGRSLGQFASRRLPSGATDEAVPAEVAIALGAVVLVVVAGVLGVRSLAVALRKVMEHHGDQLHGTPLGLVVSFLGYLGVALCVLVILGKPVGGLLLGGALTGVLVGIAAQQVLANFFAGIVLLLVRPFTLADEVVLKSGPLGGEYEGVVTDMGLFYVKLETKTGPVALPNAGVLASAVGPGVRATQENA